MSAWKEATTGEGKVYYWNTATKETRWQKPDDFDAASATPTTPSHDPTAVAAAWKEATHSDGRNYYYNSITRETRWEAPSGFNRSQPSARPPAPAFVAGGQQNIKAEDGYDRRDRRRDDRDHGLPQKPSFDGGRGGRPWEQRDENQGFRGAMPAKTDEPEYSTFEQAEEAFFKMLRKHNITPYTTWDEALRMVIREREYRALKDPKERKQAFEKYCIEVRAEEKGKEKERREKLKEDFRKMLATHDDIKHYTRWKTARPMIEREVVFRSASDDDVRRQMFDDYILELKKKHVEDDEAQRKSAMEELEALLQALIADPNTKWSDAEASIMKNGRLANDEKFSSLANADVLTAFDAHIKYLDRVANEGKQRDKRNHVRRERQARDGFKQLLQQMRAEGNIKAGTKWSDFHPYIAKDERYFNLLGTPGSSALDLFWDVVEDEERKLRSLRNNALDVLEDRRYEMTIDTTLGDFAEVMHSDARTASLGEEEMHMVYERLMEKIKKRAEEDRLSNERHHRKAIDALRSVIKHLDPPVRATDKYEDVVGRLHGYEEFTALNDDEARRSAFDKHIRRLKEKAEDAERERARRDRSYRNGSRRDYEHDRERRHRTRTPEVDAYEADRRKAQEARERQYRKPSFGLTPPPRDLRDDEPEPREFGKSERYATMSHYDRERRERERERERSYVSRADPRDKGRTLDYGDEDAVGSRPGSIRKRRESDGNASRRDTKRPRRGRTPEEETLLKAESPALQSGSEEGEIEEV